MSAISTAELNEAAEMIRLFVSNLQKQGTNLAGPNINVSDMLWEVARGKAVPHALTQAMVASLRQLNMQPQAPAEDIEQPETQPFSPINHGMRAFKDMCDILEKLTPDGAARVFAAVGIIYGFKQHS